MMELWISTDHPSKSDLFPFQILMFFNFLTPTSIRFQCRNQDLSLKWMALRLTLWTNIRKIFLLILSPLAIPHLLSPRKIKDEFFSNIFFPNIWFHELWYCYRFVTKFFGCTPVLRVLQIGTIYSKNIFLALNKIKIAAFGWRFFFLLLFMPVITFFI